jgi:eukaryotic-like serine/threonine-protein kinase
MKAGEAIFGYKLVTDGKISSGRCMWAFAEKAGKFYFVKQFGTPKYPTDETPGSSAGKKAALKRCEVFEASQQRILDALRYKVASGGSVVAPVEFGRVGPIYYKIYDRIDVANLTPHQIAEMPTANVLLIARVVAHSISILHKEHIVHGDIKPANILIKRSDTGAFTSKLIDFDDSYFEGEPPEDPEQVVGDQIYYSPELLDYILTGDQKKRSAITCKSDIFAMGLIFHEYWTGDLPGFNASKFSSCAAAALSGDNLIVNKTALPGDIAALMESMLNRSPKARPAANEVLSTLKSGKLGVVDPRLTPEKLSESSRLLGKRRAAGLPTERIGIGGEKEVDISLPPPSRPPSSRLVGKRKV